MVGTDTMTPDNATVAISNDSAGEVSISRLAVQVARP
jgi:hypothetical protein